MRRHAFCDLTRLVVVLFAVGGKTLRVTTPYTPRYPIFRAGAALVLRTIFRV